MLRGDVRQYPTYPNGYLIRITTGFIAAAMGEVALPALLNKNYVAVTFLTIAIQQFRDIRKIEKESLKSMEKELYAPRGEAYIDGIAKTFEARNYIVMIGALATTSTAFILNKFVNYQLIIFAIAFVIGFTVVYMLRNFTRGHHLKDIVNIKEASLSFTNCNLHVGDIYVMNIGLSSTRERILKNGIGLILKPKGDTEKVILNSEGQRKAIIHECSRLLGLERYGTTRRNFDTGELALMVVPIEKDVKFLKKIIENVPILETMKKEKENKVKGE